MEKNVDLHHQAIILGRPIVLPPKMQDLFKFSHAGHFGSNMKIDNHFFSDQTLLSFFSPLEKGNSRECRRNLISFEGLKESHIVLNFAQKVQYFFY